MQTIQELEAWLESNCYNFDWITIGGHHAPEGDIFKRRGGKYVHIYSERGNDRLIEEFSTEKELVDYAQQVMAGNKWARAHIVAFVFDEKKIGKVELLLKKRKISFERNDMPAGRFTASMYLVRIFYNVVILGKNMGNKRRMGGSVFSAWRSGSTVAASAVQTSIASHGIRTGVFRRRMGTGCWHDRKIKL